MAQIKTNCRTIIDRGNEISKDDLNRQSGIYAVSRRSSESREPVWGIVEFNGDSDFIRSYNVTIKNKWDSGLIIIDNLRFYEPTQMERDFVKSFTAEHRYEFQYKQAAARLKLYRESRWHRVAETLRTFFSV